MLARHLNAHIAIVTILIGWAAIECCAVIAEGLKQLKFLVKMRTNRIENDSYPTPTWMTECLIKYADIHGSIFEPCAGKDLAIAKCLEKDHIVTTNDLYEETADYQQDATLNDTWWRLSRDDMTVANWVITNPPFNCQQQIIRHAYKYARVGVAMLLRVSADEMTMGDPDRYNWWADHPESLSIKMPRFSFAKSSKSGKWAVDNTYCQWFVWRKDGHIYPQQVIRLPHDRIEGFTRQPAECLS
jgi:hypothetical protein